MIKYILKRLFLMLITFLLIITLLFYVCRIVMLTIYLPPHPFMDDVIVVSNEFIKYIEGIVTRWDWGKTMQGADVWEMLLRRAPLTIMINIASLIIYVVIGIILGVISAFKINKLPDHLIGIFIMVFSSLHSFILIFILMLIFGYSLRWLPTQYPPSTATLQVKLLGFILPIIALSLMPIAEITRLTRGELTESLDSDYILLARLKGLKKRQLVFRHGFRNTLATILPFISTTFMSVMLGSVFIEMSYGVPGLAEWFIDSVTEPHPFIQGNIIYIDTNSVVGITAFYSLLSLIINLLIDITYRLIDPRIKIGVKK